MKTGLPDIYVACDQTPSLLYINKGNGKFEEEAVIRGVAFDQNGKAMSGMGLAEADYAGDGHRASFEPIFPTSLRRFITTAAKAILTTSRWMPGWGRIRAMWVGERDSSISITMDGRICCW